MYLGEGEFDFLTTKPVESKVVVNKVGQEQLHGLLFGDKLSWQAIIYDLINTEQLDPWDIDLVLLTNKYLVKVRELEEADFFVSSKVLFAASLLLRIKSEILLNDYLQSLDDILFGKKEDKKYVQERIELDEDIPDLIPRTPLPRFKKVTLQELLSALGKAISTENRRIRKVVVARQQELETAIAMPHGHINIKNKIREVYDHLRAIFLNREERVSFSELVSRNGNDKVATFVPLLHLDFQHKVFLEQEKHLEEIYVWLKHLHEEKNKVELERMRREVEEFYANIKEDEEEIEEIEENVKKGPKKKSKKEVNSEKSEISEEEDQEKV